MIEIKDHDDVLRVAHRHLLNHTGPANLIAAALTCRLFEAAIDGLSPDAPPDRRAFLVRMAFSGPGIIDGIEYVTRAKSEGRLIIAPEIAPAGAPASPFGPFHFEFYLRNRGCALTLRDGWFTTALSAQVERALNGELTAEEEAAYRRTREDVAARILAAPIEDLLVRRPIDEMPVRVRLLGGPDPRAESPAVLTVRDGDDLLDIGLDDMILLHGRENIGGVALGFKALEYAFARLSPETPPDRRAITVFSAFAGSGLLDAFEATLRVASDDRLTVDSDHRTPQATPAATGYFFFRMSMGKETLAFTVRPGAVPDRFMELARKNKAGQLNPVEKSVFQAVKEDLAMALMGLDAEQVFVTV